MFAYSGIKQDKHVRDHEVYSVRSHANQVASIGQPDTPKDERRASDRKNEKNKFNWKYAVPSLLVIAAIFAIVKLTSAPSEPNITLAKSAIAMPTKVPASLPSPAKPSKDGLMPNETVENLPLDTSKPANENKLATQSKKTLQEEIINSKNDAVMQENVLHEKLAQDELAKKEAKKKARKEAEKKASQEAEQQAESGKLTERQPTRVDYPKSINVEATPVDRPIKVAKTTPEKDKTKEKSFLESFTDSIKQGQKSKCDQGKIAMGQCN
jgi:hypothetical protein